MTKSIAWDEFERREKARRRGTENAYIELPPVGSWADQQRFFSRATPKQKVKAPVPKIAPPNQVEPKPLAPCPVCGALVGKMKRHLRRAHGAVPGHEHEAPATTPSNGEILP
jgi:hypothetical protein